MNLLRWLARTNKPDLTVVSKSFTALFRQNIEAISVAKSIVTLIDLKLQILIYNLYHEVKYTSNALLPRTQDI